MSSGGALEGKVALVTGAGSGNGRAVVERFVAEGARLGALDIAEERVRALEATYPGAVLAIAGDVGVYADHERAVAATVEAFGGLDVLVANAGVYDQHARIRELEPAVLEDAFDEVFRIDVKGYLLAVKAAVDELAARRGCVVMTASIAGERAGFGGVLYVPAKHAVVGLIRQLAHELAPEVRVNGVAFGYVATGLTGAGALGGGAALPDPEAAAARIPLGVAPRPGDVVGAYVLLASERDGAFITGTTVLVDGGQALGAPARQPGAVR